VLFNDPAYVASVYKPGMFTSIISQLWVSIFFVLMLKYWLRGFERAKDQQENMLHQLDGGNSRPAQGVRKMSPMEKAKAAYFFLLMLSMLSLYVTNLLNVASNPAFITTPSSYEHGTVRAFLALLVTTAVLLAAYCVLFLVTLVRNFWYLCRSSPSQRALYLFSLCMMLVAVLTVCFGVYSPLYANGHIFVFFIALSNMYVWALVYLNWPVVDPVQGRKGNYDAGDAMGSARGYDSNNRDAAMPQGIEM